jgi:hypothetical protein
LCIYSLTKPICHTKSSEASFGEYDPERFKYFAESVDIALSSEADNLRQELVVICAELLTTVREEILANSDSVI